MGKTMKDFKMTSHYSSGCDMENESCLLLDTLMIVWIRWPRKSLWRQNNWNLQQVFGFKNFTVTPLYQSNLEVWVTFQLLWWLSGIHSHGQAEKAKQEDYWSFPLYDLPHPPSLC